MHTLHAHTYTFVLGSDLMRSSLGACGMINNVLPPTFTNSLRRLLTHSGSPPLRNTHAATCAYFTSRPFTHTHLMSFAHTHVHGTPMIVYTCTYRAHLRSTHTACFAPCTATLGHWVSVTRPPATTALTTSCWPS